VEGKEKKKGETEGEGRDQQDAEQGKRRDREKELKKKTVSPTVFDRGFPMGHKANAETGLEVSFLRESL